jgi:hypothetical protein
MLLTLFSLAGLPTMMICALAQPLLNVLDHIALTHPEREKFRGEKSRL